MQATVRIFVKNILWKLGDGGNNPTYILSVERFSYRMEKGEAKEEEG